MNLIGLAERGYVPDPVVRFGIRELLRRRMREIEPTDPQKRSSQNVQFANDLRDSPLALDTAAANEQHYEVPAKFFQTSLGPRLKYSCCHFETPDDSLPVAEEQMLHLTCQRAEIEDGMNILELGCGWGSLTLWMAEHYPESAITAISNSKSQREFILSQAASLGLSNLTVITSDMRDFDTDQQFNRIVSVEMFEHMRNYELLLKRISRWLTPAGKLFVHIFCHRHSPYLFEAEGAINWMGQHFFSGGMMPSEDIFSYFKADMAVEKQWQVSGLHYWRTCELWLDNLDHNKREALSCFRKTLPLSDAKLQLQRWRMFFMACAELFRFRDGNEWYVGHYLLKHTNT